MRFFRLSSRELIQLLKAQGAAEMAAGRGKGNHRMFERVHSDGKTYRTVVPGNEDCVAPGTLKSIRRGLKLTPDDGCSDEAFKSGTRPN
jgi:predicted RNA binding protein YcfA (HicA-like mRNA interferase family)